MKPSAKAAAIACACRGTPPLGPDRGAAAPPCLPARTGADAAWLKPADCRWPLDSRQPALGAAERRRLPAAAAAATAAADCDGDRARARSRWSPLSWRQPLPGLLRLVLSLAVIVIVMVMMPVLDSAATPAARCWLRCWRSSRRRPFGLRDARSLLGFALFAPFATFLLDQGPLSLVLGLSGRDCAPWPRCNAWPTWNRAMRHAPPRRGSAWPASAPGRDRPAAGTGRVLAVPAPGHAAVGRARTRPGAHRPVGPDEPGRLARPDGRRHAGPARALLRRAAATASRCTGAGRCCGTSTAARWTQPRWLRGLPAAAGRARRRSRWDYEIELEPTDRRQLVALDLPPAAPDGSTLDPRPRPAVAVAPAVRRDALAPAVGAAGALRAAADAPAARSMRWQLPARLQPAHAGAGAAMAAAKPADDDAAIVRARAGLDASRLRLHPGNAAAGAHMRSTNSCSTSKAGFCQHFSSSFVVLMRAPASRRAWSPAMPAATAIRSATTGWCAARMRTPGPRSGCRGRGWVRVDPTAAVAPERIYDTLDDRAAGAAACSELADSSLLDVGDWMRRGWNDLVLGFDASRQQRLLRPLGIDRLDGRTLVAAVRCWPPRSPCCGWSGCSAPRRARSATRCCAPGTCWRVAIAAWAWSASPHETGRGAGSERVAAARPELAAACRFSATVSPIGGTLTARPGGRSTTRV